jgi:uncharacterized protein (DUF1778 family)
VYCILRYKRLSCLHPLRIAAMTATAKRKEYPISMRLPEADVGMIDRAAVLRGRSRTDFVRDAAVRAAEEVLMEQRLVRMTPEGFADFMKAISVPAAPVAEMVKLLRRPAPWEPGHVARRITKPIVRQ